MHEAVTVGRGAGCCGEGQFTRSLDLGRPASITGYGREGLPVACFSILSITTWLFGVSGYG